MRVPVWTDLSRMEDIKISVVNLRWKILQYIYPIKDPMKILIFFGIQKFSEHGRRERKWLSLYKEAIFLVVYIYIYIGFFL